MSSWSSRCRVVAACVFIVVVGIAKIQAQAQASDADIRLNVVVSATGNLQADGKGVYRTGEDFVAAWLNPTRWPDIAFNICLNWPFNRYPGIFKAADPTGIPDNRTIVHRITDPADPHGKAVGVFTGPGAGNDVALPKPLTDHVASLTDMAIGTSLSPRSAEVRFCSSHCTANYSVIFGEKSVFGYAVIHGKGTTLPTVSRISDTAWTITFPPQTLGRLWDRTPGEVRSPKTQEDETDLGLYYYEGNLALQIQ